jgi:bifunctional non-homologous end joining protein LigD
MTKNAIQSKPIHLPCDGVSLYYREGSSDKVYQARVVPAAEGMFAVEFAYGRRGSTLKTGTKTAQPVSHATAHEILWKLVRQKLDKGYTPGPDGTPYSGTEREGQATGVQCQLLNPVDEAGLERCIDNQRWCMQEKFDGRRMLVRRAGKIVTGINRRGLETALPQPVLLAALAMPGDRWLIDGEAVGDTLHAFDLLERDGRDLRNEPYAERLCALEKLLDGRADDAIVPVATASGKSAKEAFLRDLRNGNREGAVLKDLDAAYAPGRPASGGSQLKFKFHETASCVVAGLNGRRSVSLALLAEGARVPCGNVAVPVSQDIPEPGDVVEVRYLYAMRGSGALYQPVLLGKRDDIPPEECTVDQLKYKAA